VTDQLVTAELATAELGSPFRLEPAFVTRIWGTADLRPWYDFVAAGDPIGEVWLTGDQCRVADGALAGKTLGEVFAAYSRQMMGDAAPEYAQGASPLLLKVIFAKEKLSVQVHPDDRLARKYGQPRGKTECWYALAAESGAEVAAGLKPGVTLKTVEAEVSAGTLEQSLEVLPVAAGDLVFVDAGTVHAIWPGSVLLETQQNSDITYRLFDYGRPRELHVAKALEAIRLHTDAGKVAAKVLPDRTILVDSAYFLVEKMVVDGVRSGESMHGISAGGPGLIYLFAAEGSGTIRPRQAGDFAPVALPKCGIVAVPASASDWEIEDAGDLALIQISPRWPEAA
jgi:mannose-6-phosphate isomerase